MKALQILESHSSVNSLTKYTLSLKLHLSLKATSVFFSWTNTLDSFHESSNSRNRRLFFVRLLVFPHYGASLWVLNSSELGRTLLSLWMPFLCPHWDLMISSHWWHSGLPGPWNLKIIFTHATNFPCEHQQWAAQICFLRVSFTARRD